MPKEIINIFIEPQFVPGMKSFIADTDYMAGCEISNMDINMGKTEEGNIWSIELDNPEQAYRLGIHYHKLKFLK